ncbi:hypothetical protein HRbin17_02598 [bacterium HR17]|uniref:Uncharacterized protein n=1 Tax=Candidatus Fervidibacter japonicus TaxID=2035412 RepID=A0A2H5XFU9_9BACT|nr:hypothetical protein HRbin17_02598 [bacterium HR17]
MRRSLLYLLALWATETVVAITPAARPKVVVFIMDGLSYRQVLPQGLLAFGREGAWLARNGSLAVLNTMGYGGADRFRAAMTIACGMRAFGDQTAAWVLHADEPLDADTALGAFRRRVGAAPLPAAPPPFKPLVFPMLAELRWRNERMQKKPLPFGVVVQSLRRKSIHTVAIGTGDYFTAPQIAERYRHGLLMALDEHGVGVGVTGTALLRKDPTMPFGLAVDARRWRDAIAAAWRVADFLVLFPGETLRADLYGSERLIPVAVRRELQLLRPVIARMDMQRDLLLVFSLAPSRQNHYEHTFLCAVGKDTIPGGTLTSATTHQIGVVSILDIPATVLHFFGAEAVRPINGAPLESVAVSQPLVPYLFGIGEAARITDSWWRVTALAVWCIAQAVIFVAVTVMLLAERRVWDTGRIAMAGIAWLPAVVHLSGSGVNKLLQHDYMMGVGQWMLGALSAAVAAVWSWRDPTASVRGAAVWTSAVFAADAVTGGALSTNTPLGYSTFFGGRYYGLGNVGMGLMLGAVFALALTGHWQRWAAAVAGAVGTVLVGAPIFGADIGGALTGAALTGTILGAGRWRWWHIALVLSVTAALLGVFAAWELARPEPLTHWGRFVHSIAQDGFQVLLAMVWTKLGITLRAFRAAHWDIALAAQAVAMAALWWQGERSWRFWALVVGSVVACLLNDSGPQTPVAFGFLPLCALMLSASATPSRTDKSVVVLR